MKKLFVLILFTFLLLPFQKAEACEIHFSVVGDEKENYQTGDEIVLKVVVVFTHRHCHEGIESTKFKYDGLKVLGATKWEETEFGTFERKLKIEVVEDDGENLKLEAIRTCRKEGGFGTISLSRG